MKKVIETGFIAVFLLVVSCTKENAKPSALLSQSQSADNLIAFTMGEHYGGGIIFYIDSTGQHGLIADTVDLPGQYHWKVRGPYITTGVTDTVIGTGAANTKQIVEIQGKSETYAALACSMYKGSGYKDWYLPSKNELTELYKQQKVVKHFRDRYYWSSSENGTVSAFAINFLYDLGTVYDYRTKDENAFVRPIRSF